jgi:hypothetical protein
MRACRGMGLLYHTKTYNVNISRTSHRLFAQSVPYLCYFRAGARTDEEDSPISCGRFFLTYYSLFHIFNSPKASSYHFLTSQEFTGWKTMFLLK